MKHKLLLIALLFLSSALSAQDYMRQAAAAKSSGNYDKAAALYKQAISAGQNAYYDLASLYDYDLNDEAAAYEWYRKGSEKGDQYCQGCLADMLRDGRGTEKNIAEARKWYVIAAKYWDASNDASGPEYAFQYYQSAAKLADLEAMQKLAEMYATGRGTAKNPNYAKQWLSRVEQVKKLSAAEPALDAAAKATPSPEPAVVPAPASKPAPKPVSKPTPKPVRQDAYSVFAKNYVEGKINEWQKKDEFEKTEVWKARVSRGRDSLVNVYTSKAEAAYIAEEGKKYGFVPGESLTLGQYDSDNEVFLITHEHFGNMLLDVPIASAPDFKNEWKNQEVKTTYYIDSDTLAVATLRFENPRTHEVFTFSDKKSLNYSVARIDYNFAPIDFTPSTSINRVKGSQNISESQLAIGGSEVDINIPESRVVNDKTFAVVIGNENYQTEASVQFACNDANAFSLYCTRTLGLPQSNVHVVNDATLNNLRREISWLTSVSKSYGGEATVLFYYSGHGIPDEADKSAYILPVDGYGTDVSTGYKLGDLYARLSDCGAKNAIVLLDACFSGASRTGEMIRSARGVALKADTRPAPSVEKMIIISAATGDETAYPYVKEQHGMFTYYLLNKLGSSKGSARLGELFDYIKDNVSRKSIVENQKSQTPTVIVTDDLKGSWRNISLR